MPSETRLALRVCVRDASLRQPRIDVDLDIAAGITVFMGPSGSGKTTLLSTVAGLIRPTTGHIALDRRVLFDSESGVFVPPHRRRVALLFQSLALFPNLSVWQNVAFGLPKTDKADKRKRALFWLERTHVAHLATRVPSTLSGGEAQRVALARALASEPHALLLDEPFSALDIDLRWRLGNDLQALVRELGIPTLLVTHDPSDAAKLGDKTYRMHNGRVVDDPPQQARVEIAQWA